MIEEENMDVVYEHENQISCIDFSSDESVFGFGDIEGKAVLLLHEDYEVVLWVNEPGQEVNVVKCIRKTDNFIFGFDHKLSIYTIKGDY